MADPAHHPPDGGGNSPHSEVLLAVAGERLEGGQGDLLPLPGQGGHRGLDFRKA